MLEQDKKDIKDLTELIRDLDGGMTKFNTRTTELLRKSLIYMRDVTLTRHTYESALVASIRRICAREFKLPPEHPFFESTFKEDFEPLGFSHDDALLEMFRQNRMGWDNAAKTDEEVTLVMCHG